MVERGHNSSLSHLVDLAVQNVVAQQEDCGRIHHYRQLKPIKVDMTVDYIQFRQRK